jgi:iron complex transport system substrate-binding protein
MNAYPQRIVCLTAETTETLYLLGEQRRIVGISGFTARPPQARREKPRVSAFTSARVDRIEALQPDLVLGFCELQAEILATLAARGIAVHLFNQRSIAGILDMIRSLGGMVGCEAKANDLAARLEWRVEAIRAANSQSDVRPRIYFEEWNEPPISAIRWVSELIEVAGGDDCFAELSQAPLAGDRIIRDAQEIVRRAPDIIIGSWCGKKFQPQRVASRAGWQSIPAVAHGELHEIKSSLILAPGPAALTDGLDELQRIVRQWRERRSSTSRDTLANHPKMGNVVTEVFRRPIA